MFFCLLCLQITCSPLLLHLWFHCVIFVQKVLGKLFVRVLENSWIFFVSETVQWKPHELDAVFWCI